MLSQSLFILNHDQPGVVGTVGTLLGEAGVNISRMQLALKGGLAAMLVNIDTSPAEAVLESLRNLENVISADLLELGV